MKWYLSYLLYAIYLHYVISSCKICTLRNVMSLTLTEITTTITTNSHILVLFCFYKKDCSDSIKKLTSLRLVDYWIVQILCWSPFSSFFWTLHLANKKFISLFGPTKHFIFFVVYVFPDMDYGIKYCHESFSLIKW